MQADMNFHRLICHGDRTNPYDIFEPECRLSASPFAEGLLYSLAGHLQMGNARQNRQPFNNMISEEKLLAGKSRAEPLLHQAGGVLVQQRVQNCCGGQSLRDAQACGASACLARIFCPVVLPGKWVRRQRNFARPIRSVQLEPVHVQPFHPKSQYLTVFSALHPLSDRFLNFLICGQRLHRSFIDTTPVHILQAVPALQVAFQLLFQFWHRSRKDTKPFIHGFPPHLQRVGHPR
ncbi:hypothetical protein D3C73_563050 [compost metagenome]